MKYVMITSYTQKTKMNNLDKPHNEATTGVVGGGGQTAKTGGLFAWLHRIWQAGGVWGKVLIAVSLVSLSVIVLLVVMRATHSPNVPTNIKKSPAASPSAPGGGNQPANNGDSSAKAPNTTPGSSQKAQKSKSKGTTSDSSGGSTSSGGGSSGGGSTASCALPKYPDATCTGVPAGTSLTVVNSGMDINTDNTIIEGKDIRGCVNVHATGVIIRKSKINCPRAESNLAVELDDQSNSGTRLTIEDSEISCDNNNGTAIAEANITARRLNIHGCENGFDLNQDMTIEDSYIHDLVEVGADPHTDGIQFATGHFVGGSLVPGSLNITIRHNTIYIPSGTSAIISNHGGDKNVLIENNLMAGGAFTLYCEQDGTSGTNYQVLNNHFSTIFFPRSGDFGPSVDCNNETYSGNVYHESGLPVDFTGD
jgi:hypothetical protein